MIIALQTLVFFRESLLTALDRLLRPYYKHLTLAFSRNGNTAEDEEPDDQVFAEYDDEKGVVFYPPMYAQRYAAVSDCLMDERWCGRLEKVVDFGHHDMSFIKYLKEVPGIRYILGVDIETIPLRCSSDLFGGEDYAPKRESPLEVVLYQGNAADPDYRLIGCDAVIAIEMIEHMLPHDLDRLVHTVFGFIKPWIVVFTTPNADFNVLFKAMEKNGLRRWDHLFEWTREQFHDWCSNIVVRYPSYTVTCQGIGPGPPGTLHYGCCSQLAMFVSKHYHKQADLHLNSLALVTKPPDPNNLSEVFESWECSDTVPAEVDCGTNPQAPNRVASLTEVLYPERQSHMTLVISSTLCPSIPYSDNEYSMDSSFTYHDKTLQCNLDNEIGKSFMMYDYEQYYDVLVPRRRVSHRVYEIEDVYSRLNCTTRQVKKFSKTTQNLMAKNKIDSLVHTREVVNEIRHLTKTLNFNKFHHPEDGSHVWSNINWGDNAPYWNQYYKTVREYIYPFETKSEEVRILDLVSDEISRLIDTQYDDEISVDVNRLEIPLNHLMNVVQHITNDVDRIRDLLEWNGYEIINDVVIHSRLVVDATSVATHEEDWQDNDTMSDWDNTDVHSTTVSDASTIVPDYHGRCLHRALDHKVRSLRAMLSADEDITTELDKIVCKLMKLALHSSRGRQSPPPTRWMQCKLLDLLTLTEKAIGRRKKHFIESYPVKAIEFVKPQEIKAEGEIEQDIRVKGIVDRYRHLIHSIEKTTNTDDATNGPVDDIEDEDFLSTTSNEFLKDFEYVEGISPSLVIPQPVFSSETFEVVEAPAKVNSLERTKAWVDEDVDAVPYAKRDVNYENISSGDTDHSISKSRHKQKKSSKKHKPSSDKDVQGLETAACRNSQSKITYKTKIKHENKSKKKSSNTRIAKKAVKNKSGYNTLVKNPGDEYTSAECENFVDRPKKKNKGHQSLNVTASKPIPESLIELCHQELKMEKGVAKVTNITNEANILSSNEPSFNISATEESFFVDIVTQDYKETIALRRTIGTDAEAESEIIKGQVDVLANDSIQNFVTKHEVSTENVQSQTIFLNDINEPSTSKGIRHNISTDVQCGPDTLAVYPTLSASTSQVRIPQAFSTGIKIHDIVAEPNEKGTDFSTLTQDNNNITTITPRLRSVGIKIKDSDVNICTKTECSTMTVAHSTPQPASTVATTQLTRKSFVNTAVSSPETKLIKPVSSTLKIEDSGSEFCAPSIASSSKTFPFFMNLSKNTSDVLLETSPSKEHAVIETISVTKYAKPRLCCGGVHVHSYRDKQISEDIVYQGEWQRYRPKTLSRKKTYNIMTSWKVTETASRKKKENVKEKKVNSKEKVFTKRLEKNQNETEPKKPAQIRNYKLHKVKLEDIIKEQIKKPHLSNSLLKNSTNIMKIPRPIKNVTKVASKIAMSGISSKNVKSTFTVKKPAILTNVTIKKDNEKQPKLKKSYIPLYLKRTAEISVIRDKNRLNKSIDSANAIIKSNSVNKIAPLVRSKTDEIRKDLLKFSDELRENISYIVFQNNLEEMIESPDEQTSENTNDPGKSAMTQMDKFKRSQSPQSINSSTCSSPNSIATVRAVSTRVKTMSNRRHSGSSYKSSLNNSESDTPLPAKTKKIVKRCKTVKKTESKDIDNKENIPESTKNFGRKDRDKNNDKDKINSSPFVGRHKNVYISQLKPECSSTLNTLSRHKTQIPNKSNIKIPTTPKDDDEKPRSNSPTVSKKRSLKFNSNTSSSYGELNKSQTESFGSSDSANMVLVLEPQSTYEELSDTHNISQISSYECPEDIDNNLLAEWTQNSSLHSHASSILNSMRQLLEETLDLIVSPYDHNIHHIDSQTVIISRDNKQKSNMENVAIPGSKANTLPGANLNSSFVESDIENALNRTFDSILGDESLLSLNDTRLTVTDLDLLSFKSITSVSKYSEYFLADNEFSTSEGMEQTHNTTSVRDIFERKDPHNMVQSTPGALAVQAFSGFSLGVEAVAGDQPDPVALIDSETGSVGLDINRQATSEELFISGRSSDSYESCLLDEDAVVPNWLFQIISQQQSVEEHPEPAVFGPAAAPMDEPLYDANGNVIEPTIVGVGAGAGDGRGMHSDHSQDSSGRGTSLSSSDTSSGQQSEAILIDPLAYTAQFEILQDTSSSVLVPAGRNRDLSDTTYRIDDVAGTTQAGHRDVRTRTLNGASDIDADISSLDTDVPDSSDN